MSFNKEKICPYCFEHQYECEYCGFKFSSKTKLDYYICGCCGKKTIFCDNNFEANVNNFKKKLRRKQ